MLSPNDITQEQQKIIEYLPERDLYVEAPAGHGKTSTAMLKAGEISKLLKNNSKQQVLVLTFSKMAVRQIDHERQFLLPKELQSKIIIKTYHAFYYDLIRQYARYLGFEGEDFALITSEERKSLYALFSASTPGLEYLHFSFSQYLSTGISTPQPIESKPDPELVSLASIFLFKYHRQEQRLGFDDFPYYAYRILSESSFICDLLAYKYPVVFLDEFQNTNELQWTIIKCFSKGIRMVVFGDRNQTIHAFRGAGHVIEQFKEERNPYILPLTINFRNSSSLFSFAKGIAEGDLDMTLPDNITFHRMGLYSKDKWKLKFDILNSFRGNKAIHSIAILAKENREVAALSEMLSKKTPKTNPIPHEIISDDFGMQDLENVVFSLFQFVLTRNSRCLVGIASTLSACSTGKANYLYYLNQAAELGQITPEVIKVNHDIPGYQNSRVIIESIRLFLESNPPKGFDDSWQQTQLLLQRFQFIKSLPDFTDAYKSVKGKWDLFSYRESNPTLDSFMHYFLAQRRRQNFLEQRSYLRGVFVMTLHQSQGKQFDAVFIWRCNDETIPHPDEIRKGDLTPSRYLLYVGITRARHFVRIYYEDNQRTKPSRLIQPFLGQKIY